MIYKRGPINDKPSEEFEWGNFYENGTNECYELFRRKAKIPTYKSLKWHLYAIWYLNPDMDQNAFESIARFICDRSNGFVTFNVSEQLLQSMMYDVSLKDLDEPPYNKTRKIIFKDNCKLTLSEKLSIVGKMIGKTKRVTESDIYDAMLPFGIWLYRASGSPGATFALCSALFVLAALVMGTALKLPASPIDRPRGDAAQ